MEISGKPCYTFICLFILVFSLWDLDLDQPDFKCSKPHVVNGYWPEALQFGQHQDRWLMLFRRNQKA